MISSVPAPSGLSRETPTAAPGTPMQHLIRHPGADVQRRLQPLMSRARSLDLDAEQTQGEKRPPEVDVEDLHQQSADAGTSDVPSVPAAPHDALQLDASEILEAASS